MNSIQCSIDACDRRSVGPHGWCDLHWKRWYRHGDPEKVLRPRKLESTVCSIDECDRAVIAKGLCSRHYQAQKKSRRGWVDIPGERWLPIPGYEGVYDVSDHGRVVSVQRVIDRLGVEALLRPRLRKMDAEVGSDRRRAVMLYRDGQRVNASVHSLVALAFLGPRPDGQLIRHLDGDHLNNHVSNLKYGTPVENMADMRLHGRAVEQTKTHCVNGHERTDANTLYEGKARIRRCRPCVRQQARAKHERNKAKRAAAQREGVSA